MKGNEIVEVFFNDSKHKIYTFHNLGTTSKGDLDNTFF